MNNRISSALKAASVAFILASASAHATPSPGTLEAWQQAKYPLLFPSTTAHADHAAHTDSNVPAPGTLAAWQQAKFGWLKRGTHEAVADANVPSPGSVEAWRQAKYPALSKR